MNIWKYIAIERRWPTALILVLSLPVEKVKGRAMKKSRREINFVPENESRARKLKSCRNAEVVPESWSHEKCWSCEKKSRSCKKKICWEIGDGTTVAHNCHGKRKNLAAKEKDSRQKEEPYDKKEKTHGKRKNITAKEKNLTAKRKDSRQKKKNLLALTLSFMPWGHCYFFRRESFTWISRIMTCALIT